MSKKLVIYHSKTKDGNDFVIRYPKNEDLEKLLPFINTLSAEQTFISLQGEQFTLEEEREVLEEWIRDINKGKTVHLLVFVEGELAGSSGITLHEKMGKHVGEFGIVIAKEFRNHGIGKVLMEKVIEEAEKNLQGLRIIRLGCFANNEVALNLYKELGFVQYGRLPGGLNYKGEFIDNISMYKKIK